MGFLSLALWTALNPWPSTPGLGRWQVWWRRYCGQRLQTTPGLGRWQVWWRRYWGQRLQIQTLHHSLQHLLLLHHLFLLHFLLMLHHLSH